MENKEKKYCLEQVENIIEIDRRASELMRKHNDHKFYVGENVIDLRLYNELSSVLGNARRDFPEVFLDFDERYQGKNLPSKTMALCQMFFDGLEAMLKRGEIEFDYAPVNKSDLDLDLPF